MLLVKPLDEGKRLPKDVPLADFRTLLGAVQKAAVSTHSFVRYIGRLDRAWVLLMLHRGLRTCEVRTLKLADIDLDAKKVRIKQLKGLPDRYVFLSALVVLALKSYLEGRVPENALPEEVFILPHQALNKSYCYEWLRTYGKRSGVNITPHQLRHTAATLLLITGTPVLMVQAILGHGHVNTTLGYARLYDQAVATKYYRAMRTIERQTAMPDDEHAASPGIGELISLTDALCSGRLGTEHLEALGVLRAGLVALAGNDQKNFTLGSFFIHNFTESKSTAAKN